MVHVLNLHVWPLLRCVHQMSGIAAILRFPLAEELFDAVGVAGSLGGEIRDAGGVLEGATKNDGMSGAAAAE